MAEFEVFPPAEWSESSEGSNQGQREEIERLVGEAYAKLRLKKRGEFNRKVSELSLYPRGLVEDIIREKMGEVQQPAVMRLASIHEAVTKSSHGKALTPQLPRKASVEEGREIGQVEYPLPTLPVELLPEPLRSAEIGWLAGTIDSDGHVGEGRLGHDEVGRIDRKVYRWEWTRPRVWVASTTVGITDKFDKLVKAHAKWTDERPPPKKPYHYAEVSVAKAIKLLILCEPYFVKWKEKARELTEKYRERPHIRTR